MNQRHSTTSRDLLVGPPGAVGVEMLDADGVPGPVPALVRMPALVGIEVLLEERRAEVAARTSPVSSSSSRTAA